MNALKQDNYEMDPELIDDMEPGWFVLILMLLVCLVVCGFLNAWEKVKGWWS